MWQSFMHPGSRTNPTSTPGDREGLGPELPGPRPNPTPTPGASAYNAPGGPGQVDPNGQLGGVNTPAPPAVLQAPASRVGVGPAGSARNRFGQ